MRIIIFDFEVFKHDTLFGALILENDNVEVFQTWSIPEIKNFYEENKQHIWVGWNNEHYDNHILQACVKDEDVKRVNDYIIKEGKKRYLRLHLNFFDVMKTVGFFSLKTSEALAGKKISELDIPFDLDRALTEEEKRLTETYNLDDLEQTYESFIVQQNHFILRLDTIKEFDLPLECLNMTDSMLGERVLKAKKIDNIDKMAVKPKIYDTLLIKNEDVREYFLKEKFMTGKKLTVDLCGVEHTIGLGGIHGAQKKYHTKRALYFDVSGYYNLIMIKYGLLPRAIPEEGKKLYENMYYEQLTLKKTNPKRRSVLKLILLCVFGSSLNQYLNFYDPYHGRLITLTGQLFLVDLLEKIDGKVELVQSNTDGIIVVPLKGVEDKEIHDIVNEWQERTGFNLAIEEIFDVHQRDVNYYMYRKHGKIVTVGGDTKDWEKINIFSSQKEPRIIGRSVVEFFMNNKLPEQVVDEFKREVEMFQYIAKKQSFKYVELESKNVNTGEIYIEKVQNVNRAFASNDDTTIQVLFKRNPTGKTKTMRMPGFPNNIFVYNEEILSDSAKDYLMSKIDYQHYVDKAYEKIKEFIDIPALKNISWE
jgi:DNA polymerase